MMNDFLGPKPIRSVAAFLWMPQFRLSFQHMSHIVPVFVRTLAMVFVQANLLPRNHPALMYGAEGVRKYSVSEIIGEAWFTLRTTRATVNQWGVFTGVMLMMAMVIGSLVTFMMTIAFGFGTPAQAQIFSHPLPGGSGFPSDYQPSGAFDTGVPAAGTAGGDYGIMMLDKVLRAGAAGEGVPMQNATRALMQIYNSGILVVASVIIFWMILSIVVDTAKTGQVGGGRHNMVWVPIRIVFALALLIPLGSTGYSSGQFMVMKVAEWGSNFGTRAWNAYTTAMLNEMNIVANAEPTGVSDVVYSYQQLWVCMVAVNTARQQAGNQLDREWVRRKFINRYNTTNGTGRGAIVFTDNKTEDICGTMTFDLPRQIAFSLPTAENRVSAAIALNRITDTAYSYRRIGDGGDNVPAQALRESIDKLRDRMQYAYINGLLKLDNDLATFACNFVASDETLGDAPKRNCGGDTGAKRAERPDKSQLEAIMRSYGETVKAANTAAYQEFSNGKAQQIMADMQARGWPAMGIWYHRIADLNATIMSMRRPTLEVSAGSLANIEIEEVNGVAQAVAGAGRALARTFSFGVFGRQGAQGNAWLKNAKSVMSDYEAWWLEMPEDTATVSNQDNADTVADPRSTGRKKLGLSDMWALMSGSSGLNVIAGATGFEDSNWWIDHVKADISKNPDLYPLAVLSRAGDIIYGTGWGTMLGVTAVQAVLSIAQVQISFLEILAKISLTLIVAGGLLKFYVPMIPLIRVVFAVLTWIISVFEAVVLVPIAALAHLSSDGEGLSGQASHVWKLWLNILLRPVMTVIAFVGAMLIFNAFVSYLNEIYLMMVVSERPYGGPVDKIVASLFHAVIYVFLMYTAANSIFKLLDLIPAGLQRWIGGPADQSFDSGDDRGMMYALSQQLASFSGAGGFKLPEKKTKTDGGSDGTKTPSQ